MREQHPRFGSRFEQSTPLADKLLNDLRREIRAEMQIDRPRYTKAVLASLTPEQNFVRWLLYESYDLIVQLGLRRILPERAAMVIDSNPSLRVAFEMVSRDMKSERSLTSGYTRRHPKRKPAAVKSYVYFIQADGTDLVKIGKSENHRVRLNEMQVGCPHSLKLLATMPGGCGAESKVHSQFAHLRTRGEWFRLESDLQEFIDRLAAEAL